MISSLLYAFLDGRAAITTDEIMLWPLPVDQSVFPAITFQQEGESRSHSFDGPVGLVASGVSIDVWASGAEEVQTLAMAVRDDLNGYTGAIGTSYCYKFEIDRMVDLYEIDTGLFRVSISTTIYHKEV